MHGSEANGLHGFAAYADTMPCEVQILTPIFTMLMINRKYDYLFDQLRRGSYIKVNKSQNLDDFIAYCKSRDVSTASFLKCYRTTHIVPYNFYLYLYKNQSVCLAQDIPCDVREVKFEQPFQMIDFETLLT